MQYQVEAAMRILIKSNNMLDMAAMNGGHRISGPAKCYMSSHLTDFNKATNKNQTPPTKYNIKTEILLHIQIYASKSLVIYLYSSM